jgi:hypothetical protein
MVAPCDNVVWSDLDANEAASGGCHGGQNR